MPDEHQLVAYANLIRKYHDTLDLVSDKRLETLDDFIADALAYAEMIQTVDPDASGPIIDLGSGVGMPGIPIAIALPEREIILVERRKRRAVFLNLATKHLGLHNTTVAQADIRSLSGIAAPVVTAQAVAQIPVVHDLVKHVTTAPYTLISWRGHGWEEDVDWAIAQVVQEQTNDRGSLVAVQLGG